MTAVTTQQAEYIEQHQGLLRSLAMGIHAKLPKTVELDDLISYGQLGLMEAAQEYDASRGAAFGTFAYYRIRGAIYDGLSKLQGTTRGQYQKFRQAQLANEVLQEDCAQNAATEEKPNVVTQASSVGQLVDRLATTYLAMHGQSLDDASEASLEDPRARTPYEEAAWTETCAHLHRLIAELPAEASQLVKATFFEGRTLQSAADELGLSKSWASRLLSKALDQLARSLRRTGIEEER